MRSPLIGSAARAVACARRYCARGVLEILLLTYPNLAVQAAMLEMFHSPPEQDLEITRHRYVSARFQLLIVRCTRWAYRHAQ